MVPAYDDMIMIINNDEEKAGVLVYISHNDSRVIH